MTITIRLDVPAEVAAITAALAAHRDPGYERGMRRTVPSEQPAHATRVPDVRRGAADWRRDHRGLPLDDLFTVCDALWATRWREERIVAIDLIRHNRAALRAVDWAMLERWSAGIDNWEHADHLADLTGRLLAAGPAHLDRVHALSVSEDPWQRRLALVTLIVAFRADAAWRNELESMASMLKPDKHPLVRRAVVWARDRLTKDHQDA